MQTRTAEPRLPQERWAMIDFEAAESALVWNSFLPWVGTLAAALTSLSYIPQVRKALPRGSTKDLSLGMLVVLTSGLVLWAIYGLFKPDLIIVAANSAGFALTLAVLACKIRDLRAG